MTKILRVTLGGLLFAAGMLLVGVGGCDLAFPEGALLADSDNPHARPPTTSASLTTLGIGLLMGAVGAVVLLRGETARG